MENIMEAAKMGIQNSCVDISCKPSVVATPTVQVAYNVQPGVPPKALVGSWAPAPPVPTASAGPMALPGQAAPVWGPPGPPAPLLPQGLPLQATANPTFGGASLVAQKPPPPPGPPPQFVPSSTYCGMW